jgi:short subunit dehydrogenase-like uncharacterized protein
MNDEVWVIGATGRTGKAIASRLHTAGVPLVLVGRNGQRLAAVKDELGGAPRVLVGSLDEVLSRLAQQRPAVVVNAVGPFTRTGPEVARACPAGVHYVDVANELPAVEKILALDPQAAAAGQTLVTGAGFGVLATESVVLRLCAGQPRPTHVRVDALASVAIEAGVVGPALAATIVEIVALGGRQVQGGRLVKSRAAGSYQRWRTPNGEVLGTGSGANGELIAAWRASQADRVIAASPAAPANPVVRALLPAVGPIFALPGVGRLIARLVARIPLKASQRPRPSSWGHARVQWSSGQVREGWLRTGDGMDFTAAVAAEVAIRLRHGQGRPGAYTPGALFGFELAEAAGGELQVIDESIPAESTPTEKNG